MSIRQRWTDFWDPPQYRHTAVEPSEVRSAVAIQIPTWQIGKPQWPARSVDTYTSEYSKLALIFRCVGITATSAGAAPVLVYQEDAKGKETPLPNHAMRQLMKRPNAQMRESRFIAYVTMVASVAGFCLVEKERSAAGRVVGLWPLRSDWAKPIPRSNAAPDWEYRIPGISTPTILPAENVLHFTYADRPDGSPFGLGALEVALREVGLLNVMTDFLKAFFDHGAMPVYGLIPQDGANISAEKADAIKEKWSRRHAGLQNSIDPAILQGIKDVKRLSFDFDELAFTDLRDLSDLAICSAFGIPPGLVGVRMGLERNTFANAAEMRRSFYEDTISPLWSRLDDVLTLGLLEEFLSDDERFRGDISLKFDTSDIPALQEDRNNKATWLTQAALGGLITAHTYHSELGLELPKGDDFYLRGFTVDAIPADDPLNVKAEEELPPQQVPPALQATTDVPQDPNDEDEARALRVINEWRGRRIALREGRSVGEIEKTATYRPRDVRAAIGTVNRRQIKRIADKATPWTAAYFREAGKRIAGSINSSARSFDDKALAIAGGFRIAQDLKTIEARATDPVDWKAEERELTKLLTRIYQLSGDTAYASANDQLGTSISFDLANPKLKDVRTLLAERVKGVNDESRGVIQNIVTDALESGKTVDELASDLSSKFTEWSEGRALTVARTESMTSYAAASTAQYRESGLVDRIQCFDNAAHTDDYGAEDGLSCSARDGLIAPLEDAEKHIRSEHPNGQLAISPVLTGED